MSDRTKMPKDFGEPGNRRVCVGLQLPTKDGRKVGNAIVLGYSGQLGTEDGEYNHVWTLVTDFGHIIALTESEIYSMFYVDSGYFDGGFDKWIDDRRGRDEIYRRVGSHPAGSGGMVEDGRETSGPTRAEETRGPTVRKYNVPATEAPYGAVFVGDFDGDEVEAALAVVGIAVNEKTWLGESNAYLYRKLGWGNTVIMVSAAHVVFYRG